MGSEILHMYLCSLYSAFLNVLSTFADWCVY